MNKIFFLSFFLLTFCLVQNSYAQENKVSQNLTPSTYAEYLKKNTSYQLIDVRTPGEYNGGHIENAENIDFNDRKFENEVAALDKSKTTFVYCLSGGRSNTAMKKMQDMGFKEVYNLEGGILAWEIANLPLTTPQGSGTTGGMSMEEFKKAVNSEVPVLVDFGATWCMPCKMLKPIVQKIEKEKGAKLKVLYIDVDQHKDLANELKIQSIPLLHVYKKGKLAKTSSGLIDRRTLLKLIE